MTSLEEKYSTRGLTCGLLISGSNGFHAVIPAVPRHRLSYLARIWHEAARETPCRCAKCVPNDSLTMPWYATVGHPPTDAAEHRERAPWYAGKTWRASPT